MEIWKDIKGYEGIYQISNLGRVKSLSREVYKQKYKQKELILKLMLVRKGYLQVNLCKESNMKHYIVHRLVATAFIPNPENKPCINHINGIKTDNDIENLEWCTYKENSIHAVNNGLRKYKVKNYNIKQIQLDYKQGISTRKIAKKHNVGKTLVWNIVNGRYAKNA